MNQSDNPVPLVLFAKLFQTDEFHGSLVGTAHYNLGPSCYRAWSEPSAVMGKIPINFNSFWIRFTVSKAGILHVKTYISLSEINNPGKYFPRLPWSIQKWDSHTDRKVNSKAKGLHPHISILLLRQYPSECSLNTLYLLRVRVWTVGQQWFFLKLRQEHCILGSRLQSRSVTRPEVRGSWEC